jgi:hypothetical protein
VRVPGREAAKNNVANFALKGLSWAVLAEITHAKRDVHEHHEGLQGRKGQDGANSPIVVPPPLPRCVIIGRIWPFLAIRHVLIERVTRPPILFDGTPEGLRLAARAIAEMRGTPVEDQAPNDETPNPN